MPTLICDLRGLVQDSDHEAVLAHLRRGNGGPIAVTSAQDLFDDAFEAFRRGQIGENEYARELRPRLGWRGSDADLVRALGGLYPTIDLGVAELLVDLRDAGWFLIGLDHQAGAATAADARWAGEYADQLGLFHRVLTALEPPGRAVPRVPGQTRGTGSGVTDPRFLARVRHEAPAAHGIRMLVTADPAAAAAARSQGLEAHVFHGASALRAACMLSV